MGLEPVYVQDVKDMLKVGDICYFATYENAYYDLLAFDGEKVEVLYSSSQRETFSLKGGLNDGILVGIKGIDDIRETLYYIDNNTLELTTLHESDGVISFMTTKGNEAYFLSQSLLYITDGTVEGTRSLNQFSYFDFSEKIIANFNELIIFEADNEIWRSDGTPEGTFKLVDAPFYSQTFGSFSYASSNGLAFFLVMDAEHGLELWVTDGSIEETKVITDFNDSGSSYYQIKHLYRTEQGVFFYVRTLEYGGELWKSDGTTEGTHILRDIFPGPNSGVDASSSMTYKQGLLYFMGRDDIDNRHIWVSDGTEEGTILLKNIQTEYKEAITSIDGQYIFSSGKELWKTDGTPEGTVSFTEHIDDYHFNPAHLTQFGDKIIFTTNHTEVGNEPWITDGTPGGTRLVKDINPEGSSHSYFWFTTIEDEVFFAAQTRSFRPGQPVFRIHKSK
jgi:ELWxxDGT repeat protein